MAYADIPPAVLEWWRSRQSGANAGAWIELLGPSVPKDLLERGGASDAGFLIGDPAGLLAADNAFAEVIARAQQERRVEPLVQAFSGVWFLDEIVGEGDCLMLHISRDHDSAQGAWWSHEEGLFRGPISGDLPTVDYLRHLALQLRADRDQNAFAERIKPVLGRFKAAWPLIQGVEGTAAVMDRLQSEGAVPSFTPPTSSLPYLAWRCGWLAQTLTIGRCPAIPDEERAASPAGPMNHPGFASNAPSILYWMWRALLTGDPALDEILARARSSPARLVRDAGALVAELAAGSRADVGEFRLAQLVDGVRAALAAPLSFPAELPLGPFTLRRDDSRLAGFVGEVPAELPYPVPPPPEDGDFWWGAPPNFCPFAVLHPAGDRLLIQGSRARAGALLEIGRSDGSPASFAPIDGVTGTLMRAVYLDADLVIASGTQEIVLVRRGRGVVARLEHRLPYALFVGDNRTLILHRGPGSAHYPIEVVRVAGDGDRLERVGSAPLSLEMAIVDGRVVGRDVSKQRAYLLEGL